MPLCPVRPLPSAENTAAELDDSFLCRPCEDGVPSRELADDGETRLDVDIEAAEDEPTIAQAPRGLASPSQPTPEEVALHWLTHLPYRSWCKWCVAGKRPNSQHSRLPPHSREIPLLVADYCYVRDSRDQDLLTVFVARLYPSRCMVSIPCDVKGVDDYAVGRLAHFLRCCGVTRLAYMCDQESALGAQNTGAMNMLRGTADWVGAIPENSAVGESQSNGKAESAIRIFEDQLRTMKGAFETRIATRCPSMHPVMKWLVECVSVILNKYAIQPTGKTAYHDLHGKKMSERLVEFGEVILHYIPRKRRAKLDMRWTTGVFLGTTMHSN